MNVQVTAELAVPPLLKDGVPIACPVCAQDDELTLVMVPGDFSDTPSSMRCDDMHTWEEPRVPRRLGAELFAAKERNSPESIVWSDGTPYAPKRRVGRRLRRRKPGRR